MNTRQTLWTTARIALFLGVLGLLYFVIRSIGFRNVLREMSRVGWRPVAAAAALYLAVFGLWSFRWQQLMRRKQRVSLPVLFPIYMAGVFVNLLTPGARVGGGPVRAYYMSTTFGGRKSTYMGTVLADKMTNMTVFFTLVIIATLYILFLVPIGLIWKLILQGGVLLILAAIISGFLLRKRLGANSRFMNWLLPTIYEMRILAVLRRRFPTYQHFEDYVLRKLDNACRPIRRAFDRPRYLGKALAIGVLSWFLYYMAYFVLFRALGVQIAPLPIFVIFIISVLTGDTGISPGGAGLMETAMIGLCAAFGVEYGAAAAVTLISRGLFYVYGFGLGGICLATLHGIDYLKRRQPTDAEPRADANRET